jgi:biopolymer transport protein ExbD
MTTRRHGEAGPEVTLPITPMLDMAFQLLFFFIVNFNPTDLEGQVSVSLPAGERAVPPAAAKPADALAFPADVAVRVRTWQGGRQDGHISALFLRDKTGKERAVDGLKALYAELVQERVTSKEAITIQADGNLKVKRMLAVMDVCRKAGFTRVSLVRP